jgi:outer membrane protein OmpA-like peptidoglycan-associated protein
MNRITILGLVLAAACATGEKKVSAGGSSPWMCMPCTQPCTEYPGCSAQPKVAVATPPAPAPVPAPVVAPAPPPPPPVASAAEFSPAPGTFVGAQAVRVTSATPGAVTRCTLDGSEPTAESPVCPDPLMLPANTTVKALVTAPGHTASAVASGDYVIQPPPPPPRAVVSAKKIELNEKVMFEVGKAKVKTASFPLLDDIAGLLKAHPEIKKLTVEGHSDDVGPAQKNLKLSAARADAVRKELIKRGIDAKRLRAKGYGEARPIADNKSPEGRELNRRVELAIGDE